MDGFELNKIMGAITGSLMVFLSIGWIADAVFYTPKHAGDHAKDGHHAPKFFYAAPAEEEAETEVAVAEVVDMVALISAADLDKGATVFKRKCSSCHNVAEGGSHGTGPALHGVLGRDIAAAAGYTRYSAVLQGKEGAWDWDNLNAFLTKPADWAPKTSMKFAGLKKPEDRAAVLAYLNQNSGAPLDPPAATN